MADIKQWHGLISHADPHDIPDGAAQETENFSLSTPGKLNVRGGLQPITYSPGISTAYDILAMYGWRPPAGSTAVFLDSNGDVYAGNLKTPAIESSVSTAKPPCWAESRQGDLIRIDGVARGSIYDGTTLYPLGITRPADPTVIIDSGAGNATAGDYVMGFRYKDADGNYSNLNENLVTLTASDGDGFDWTNIPSSSEARVTHKELYRSTSEQASVLYLVKTITNATTSWDLDNASDDTIAELPALSILNPDNSLNANRHTPPPEDYEILCPFQDRMFYARPKTLTAANRNKIIYSEVDLPESVPASQNYVIVQENTDDNDRITALVPHGSTMWVMKDRHAYRANFVRQPNIDMIPTLAHSRGCLNQRCWAFYSDTAFMMDRQGVWAMSSAGKQDIGNSIENYFHDDLIDFSKSDWFFVECDSNRGVVRFYVSLDGQAGDRPKTALTFHVATETWGLERYPSALGGGCRMDYSNAVRNLVGGEDGNSLLVDQGTTDIVTSATTGNPTGATSTSLEDDDASFTTGMIGASLVITNGTGVGQMRTISARPSATELTISEAWTTNPDPTSEYMIGGIYAYYKTGLFDLPPTDGGKRALVLAYQPTTNSAYAELEVYYDHDINPEVMRVSERHKLGFDTQSGESRLRQDLKGALSRLGRAPGTTIHELDARSAMRDITHRYVAAKLRAYQGDDAISLYSLEVAGAE